MPTTPFLMPARRIKSLYTEQGYGHREHRSRRGKKGLAIKGRRVGRIMIKERVKREVGFKEKWNFNKFKSRHGFY